MASIVLALLALTSVAFAEDECQDSPQPIYIDFHNRNVSDNDQNIQYGLFIGVGTPFQNQSLWPSISHNETTFSAPNFCEGNNNSQCIEQTHGFYDPEVSDTFVNISRTEFSDRYLLDETTTLPAAVALTGNDTLNVYTHYFDPSPATVTHIDNFPVSQLTSFDSDDSPWFGPSGLLGLGPSAPILTNFLNLNLISTRSFGLYLGTAYPRAGGAINGSLTLGGYDSGRITGPASTYDLATDYDILSGETPFRVSIASVVLTSTSSDSPSTNTTTILSTSPFDAYLTTAQHSMTFPSSLTDLFINATSATTQPNTFSEPSLHLPSNPSTIDYTLTVTLSTGLTVTIPPEEMRNASDASPLSAAPSSSPPNASNSSGSTPPVLLGTSFLHHLYLTTQYSAASGNSSIPPQFHLSAADPHALYVLPQPLCAAGMVPIQGDPVPNNMSAWEKNGIIGAVLGGVIGGLGLGFVAWWVWRRWRASRGRESEGEEGQVMRKGNGGQSGGWEWAVKGEEEEMRGWVALGKRMGFGRGGKGKGKGRSKGYMDVDVEGKSVSVSDGEGSSEDENVNAGEDGYGLRDFAPVAIPAAYGDGAYLPRASETPTDIAAAADRAGPDIPDGTARAAAAAVAAVPFDFSYTQPDQDSQQHHSEREPLSPASYDDQHHDGSEPMSPRWEEVTAIGRAISTPPPPVALVTQMQPPDSLATAASEEHHGDAVTLRSISPVSPLEVGFFGGDEVPLPSVSRTVGHTLGDRAEVSGGKGGGVESWILSSPTRTAGGDGGGGYGLEFTGEARTGEMVRIKRKSLRRVL